MTDKTIIRTKAMRRRAISDVIAVLLLMGITVAGAVLISTFFQSNKFFQYDTTSGSQTAQLKITGYDTRDGPGLSQITGFNNDNLDSALTAGTDFIVLNVENQGFKKVTIQQVEINDITHNWDGTAGNLPPTYPAEGTFSIIPVTGTPGTPPFNIISSKEIDRNQEVRLVVKLSSSLSDISINEPIRVRFTTDLIDPPSVIITSGGVQ